MSAALVIVVLVCGYLYINSHIPSKILFKKSTGWQSYFQVALKGSIYLIMAFTLLLIGWVLIFFVMQILSIPHYFFPGWPEFTFAYDLWGFHIAGIGMPFIALVGMTIAISLGESKQAEKQLKNPDHRRNLFAQIAQSSPVEGVLLESLNSQQQLLVSITLKSRKVYIGMVHEARLEEHDTDTVVIIPFLSGYRHKDTLSFVEEVNYADHFKECGITFTSKPISLSQYRHVIPRDQIESISLFNSAMYAHFQQLKKDAAPPANDSQSE
ncbi:hypothetical protein [Atlantibacter hermannii]|uniref:hypothetical protein n=1 Tax=Atlantibacter hermannii TaxID=565 RepID=UPI002073D29C|nr:hypothetical protein [Atlantibacter hermannii]